MKLKSYLRYGILIILLFLTTFYSPVSQATDYSNTTLLQKIVKDISDLKCNTYGSLTMWTTKSTPYTCVGGSIFNAASTVLSDFSAATMLQMDNSKITSIAGNCLLENRADPNNLVLDVAYCNSDKLVFKTDWSKLIELVFSGKMFSLDALLALLFIDNPDTFFDKKSVPLGSQVEDLDAVVLQFNDQLCTASWKSIPNISSQMVKNVPKAQKDKSGVCSFIEPINAEEYGWQKIGCKYIAEPCNSARYEAFASGIRDNQDLNDLLNNAALATFVGCGSDTCYLNAVEHSSTKLPVTGPLIRCVKQSLANTLYGSAVCTLDEPVEASAYSQTGALYNLQKGLQKSVIAFAIGYILVMGIKIVLGVNQADLREMAVPVIKLVVVLYFSIGLSSDDIGGMAREGFPLLFTAVGEIANWLMNAEHIDVCYFDTDSYADGYKDMALWDAIDCKLMHYLGYDDPTSVKGVSSGSSAAKQIPFYFFLPIVALFSGNMDMVVFAFAYPILIVSFVTYVVSTFLACYILLTCIGALGPLFIPLALFKSTEPYFKSWLEIMISFVLRPTVAVVFVVLAFKVIDLGVATDCVYTSSIVKPVGGREYKAYSLSLDPNDYRAAGNLEQCAASFTGQMQAFLEQTLTQGHNPYDSFIDQYLSYSTFLLQPGVAASLAVTLTLLYICYYFGDRMDAFASDLVGGISLGNMSLSPNTVINTAKEAAETIKAVVKEVAMAVATGGAASAVKTVAKDVVKKEIQKEVTGGDKKDGQGKKEDNA